MHRHGYKGRKFGLERDQRRALIKGLATSLVEKTSIETTLEKAKELRPYVEALVTKAKKGDLHNRRQIIASLSTISAAHKLVDQIAPKLKNRQGGYLRIKTTRLRVGDNAQLAQIGFVDDVSAVEAAPVVAKKAPAKAAAKPKAEPKGKE